MATAVAVLTACDRPSPVQPTASGRPLIPGFFLSGRVVDTAYRPIAAARVEVANGPRAGMFGITDEAGSFSIDGMFTNVSNFIASKDGYVSETRTIPPPGIPLERAVEGARWEAQFYLAPNGPSADIAGAYSLTVNADRLCPNLPPDLRARTYTATIAPNGRPGFFTVKLSDATFYSEPCTPGRLPDSCAHDHFSVGLAADYASLGLGATERLADNGFLRFEGAAEGLFRPNGFTERFTGSFIYCPVALSQLDIGDWACPSDGGARCESNTHQVTLTRR